MTCEIEIFNMKAEIEKCEWTRYPMYDIYTSKKNYCGEMREIPDDLYKRYKSNRKEFEKIQDELEKIYKSKI